MDEAITEGVAVGDLQGAKAKLQNVEMAYQDQEEAIAEKKEVAKTARELVSIAKAEFAEAMENSRQLSLFDDEV